MLIYKTGKPLHPQQIRSNPKNDEKSTTPYCIRSRNIVKMVLFTVNIISQRGISRRAFEYF